jgi:gliding motility-associated-like protein
MTKLFFFILFSLVFSTVYGQKIQSFGEANEHEYVTSTAADNDGNSYYGGGKSGRGCMIKTDSLGEILWTKEFKSGASNQNHNVNFVECIADTLFGCGWINNGGTSIGSFIFKMNRQTGDFYWLKSESQSGISIIGSRYLNGKIYLSGQKRTTGAYDIYVSCVSAASGITIWEKGYDFIFPSAPNYYIDDVLYMSHIQNGRFYMTGRSYVTGPGVSTNMRATLIGMDTSGNMILNKYLNFSETESNKRVYGMWVDFDGPDSLVIGQFGDVVCSGGCSNFLTGITKTDLNGNVSYTKWYDLPGVSTEILSSINITEDSYVLFGSSGSSGELFLLEVDKSGIYQSAFRYSKPQTQLIINAPSYFFGGSSTYLNGVHYFPAAVLPQGNTKADFMLLNMKKDFSTSSSTCFNISPTTPTTINLAPFSSVINATVRNISLTANNIIVNETTSTLTGSTCDQNDVVFTNQPYGCDSLVVNASSVSGKVYQINWSNGTSGSSSTFYQNDSIFVESIDLLNCCVVYDTINIGLNGQAPTVTLAASDSICLNESETHTITPIISNCNLCDIIWNTNETSPTIEVDSSGYYKIHVTNSCNESDSAEIQLSINFNSIISPIPNREVCEGEFPVSIELQGSHYDSILWSNGDTLPEAFFDSLGLYSVTIFSEFCADAQTSFEIVQLNLPILDSINPQVLCPGTPLTVNFSAFYFDSVFVNEQALLTNDLLISDSGMYKVVVENKCGRDSSTFEVQMIEDIDYTMNYDDVECHQFGDSLELLLENNTGEILWQDGSTSQQKFIHQSGTYSFVISNTCFSYQDEFVIEFKSQPTLQYKTPNVFTPNKDGTNDIWTPFGYCSVPGICRIYNRWGNQVYEFNEQVLGWAGNTPGGEPLNDGVYFYFIDYQQGESVSGMVHLVR